MPIMVDIMAPVTPVRPGVVEALALEPAAPMEPPEPGPLEAEVPAELAGLSGVYEPPC